MKRKWKIPDLSRYVWPGTFHTAFSLGIKLGIFIRLIAFILALTYAFKSRHRPSGISETAIILVIVLSMTLIKPVKEYSLLLYAWIKKLFVKDKKF